MNERIYKLFEQALKEFKQEHEYATYIVPDPIKEKFAELIVRECSNIVFEEGCTEDNWDCPNEELYQLSNKIEQHFGFDI